MNLTLGLSPCPNDTFIFHALLHDLCQELLPDELEIEPFFADVETLNGLAMAGKLPVTKLSLGVVPRILDKYALLSAGGALGFGCGPLLVAAKRDIDQQEAVIAIPGDNTTANLLLTLHGGYRGVRREMVFSEVMPALERGDADIGLIIHEGRFIWEQRNLVKLLDFGQWWEEKYNLPLPLGCIAVRRDLPVALGLALEKAIARSISIAWENPDLSADFIKSHAQEMDPDICGAHIKTFVNDFSMNLGEAGRGAIRELLAAAGVDAARGIFLADSGDMPERFGLDQQ